MNQRHQVRRELHRLAIINGGELTPETVVGAAADPASPLHTEFEWDDAVAAAQFRLWQARHLLLSCEITYTRPDGNRVTVREFPSIRVAEGGRRYVPIHRIVQDRDLVDQLIADYDRWLQHFAARVHAHSDLKLRGRYQRILTAIADTVAFEEATA